MALPLVMVFQIKFGLNLSPKALTFTDLIATDYYTKYGYALDQIRGIVKITSPSNIIFYQNSGWAADNYSSADIDGSGTPDWILDSVSLPLDAIRPFTRR